MIMEPKKHDFITKHNEFSAEHMIKSNNYCPNLSMETIFMNRENSKTNEPHKFILNLL